MLTLRSKNQVILNLLIFTSLAGRLSSERCCRFQELTQEKGPTGDATAVAHRSIGMPWITTVYMTMIWQGMLEDMKRHVSTVGRNRISSTGKK